MQKAGAKLLEPIMKVEVVTPEEYTGDVIGDLNSRRGQVQGQEVARQRGRRSTPSSCRWPTCSATSTTCVRCRQGRAQLHSMQFDHYAPVPSNLAQEIQEKYA